MTDILDKGGDPKAEAKTNLARTAEQAAQAVSGIPGWTLVMTAAAFFGLGMVMGRRKKK